eukprot:Skav218196  [mRNA]  locus=scaffold2410:80255:80881:- [translate_table: standard]
MVFWFLMALAASGRVKALLAGPPCRTVSALRFQNDGGPGIVRDEQHPYGLPHLPEDQRELVLQDSALWFKTLLIYMVCEDARSDGPPTALILEQPEDPRNYRDPQDVMEKGYMSMWRTKEWDAFKSHYNLKMASFDQGTMGHECRKPTTVALQLDELLVLDGMRGGPMKQYQTVNRKGMPIADRCAQSKQWSAWAPGLKAAMVVVLQR